jgi:hypothetical protein
VEDNTAYTVDVYCDDDSNRSHPHRGHAHRGRETKVVTFRRVDGRWLVFQALSAAERERQARASEGYWRRRKAGEKYDDAAYLAHMTEALGEGFDVAEQTDRRDAHGRPARYDDRFAHTTYKLRCRLCGLDVQRRHEVVEPVLERLFAAGVRRISLVSFASAIVESSNTTE